MENTLMIALAVSGSGLLILFAALALLYGLMVAMTAIFRDRPAVKPETPADRPAARATRAMRRAAVVAIALARAELEATPASSPEIQASLSPWGQYHRHRRLGSNPHARASR